MKYGKMNNETYADDICINCGGRRGLHNHMNQRCPMDINSTADHIDYRDTVFKLSTPSESLIAAIEDLQKKFAHEIEKYKEFSNNAYAQMNTKAADMWSHKRDGLIMAERELRKLLSQSLASLPVDIVQKLREINPYEAEISDSWYGWDNCCEKLKELIEAKEPFEIPTYKLVDDGLSWYYYLNIHGGTGKKRADEKHANGGDYKYYLFYARPEQLSGIDKSADSWCNENGLPCGIGDTIGQAYNDWLEKEKATPLK